MRQQVIATDEVHLATAPKTSLSVPKRFDGPHSFTDRFLGIDHDDWADHHPENLCMSWHSQLMWWCDPRQWLQAILRLKDSPHSIALGTAIGVFIGLTPTFGVQMMLVLALAFLTKPFFRFNKFAALVAVYISNPFTMIPIYWCNYRVGAVFTQKQITWDEFVELFQYSGYTEWWSTIQNVFYTLGTPLVIGSLIVATFCALPTYPMMLRLAQRVQMRRELRRKKRAQTREEDSATAAVAEPESPSVS